MHISLKVWIVLIVLTSITFLFGYIEYINQIVIGILLFSVLVKGYLISEYFMELHDVVYSYRLIPLVWLIIVLLSIAYAYYFSIS